MCLKHTATHLFHHILLSILTFPHLINNHTYHPLYLISCHNDQTHFLPYNIATFLLLPLLFTTISITMYHPIRPLLLPTTGSNTLTHSSQFSHDHTYDGPPLPQRPRLDTSLAMVDPLATATAYHSSSHVTHSLSTPFSPHVGQSSDTIPSSSGTTSSRPPFLPSSLSLILLHHNTHLLMVSSS